MVVVVVVVVVALVVSGGGNVVIAAAVVWGVVVRSASPSPEHDAATRAKTTNQVNLSMEPI